MTLYTKPSSGLNATASEDSLHGWPSRSGLTSLWPWPNPSPIPYARLGHPWDSPLSTINPKCNFDFKPPPSLQKHIITSLSYDWSSLGFKRRRRQICLLMWSPIPWPPMPCSPAFFLSVLQTPRGNFCVWISRLVISFACKAFPPRPQRIDSSLSPSQTSFTINTLCVGWRVQLAPLAAPLLDVEPQEGRNDDLLFVHHCVPNSSYHSWHWTGV